MAQNITSITALTQVSKNDFYMGARSGDLLFASGLNLIDYAIEKVTESIWSHVAMLWLLPDAQTWVVLEATATHGVSCEPLSYYVDVYNGNVALAERPVQSDADKVAAYKAGIAVLDERYNFLQIVEFLAKSLDSAVSITDTNKDFVCSALMQYCYQTTPHPLQVVGVPSPQQVWTDPTVVPKFALKK